MPLYEFRDTETDELFSEIMSYADKIKFLEDNPNIQSVIGTPNIIGGVGGIRNDDGWNETLSKIAEAHPSSALADRHRRKTTTEVKTENAVKKWRKAQNNN